MKPVLPVNYQDDILNEAMNGKRKYLLIPNADGTYCLEDATTYDQIGSNFGAGDINATNEAVNQCVDVGKIITDTEALGALEVQGYIPDAILLKQTNESLGNLFSTNEVKTKDKWVDGKPIYRKTVVAKVTTANTNFNIPHGIDNIGNFRTVDYAHSFLVRSSSGDYVPLVQIVTDTSNISGYQAGVTFINETNIIVQSGTQQVGTWTITILYTKTTD